jgi:hypothetical protein
MKKILIALTIITTALSGVRAASVFSDVFNYADGSIVANSSGIWINNSGTGLMLVSNQTLIVSTSRGEDIAHYFGSVYPTNGPVTALYSSYTIKCIGLPTALGTYFNHFTGTNAYSGLSGHRARVWAATTNAAAGVNDTSGNFYLYIVNSVGSTTNGNNQWPNALATNVTHTIVTKYVLATGSSTLWVDPNSESDPSVTDPIPLPPEGTSIPTITNGILNISHYSYRQATGEGTMLVNNLKIGTAFSDVAGANTSPTISPIPNQNTPANTAIGPITFIIGDDSPLNGLILTKGSSNPTLVPTNNIVFGGSGASRTVTITPASGQQGSSTITIFVSDGVNISSTSFLLRVGAPVISAIANQITYVNIAVGPVSFTVSDPEGDSLTVSQASSNPTLLPTGNVVLGGSGANRTVTLTPASGQTGVSTITLFVADNFNTNSTSFVLSVSPQYGVILTDDFNYTDFLQDTALQGAGGSHASPWGHASGTNYDLLVINGAAQLSTERSEDLAAGLAYSPFAADSGVLLYASFSITFSNLPTPAGDYFVHFQDTITGSNFRDKLYASTTNAAAGFFRLGVANAANTVNAQFPLDLTTNQSYFVVTRYNTGTGESVLWVNPNNEYSPSAAAQDSTTAAIVGDFGLRQTTGIGISYLDNLVVGTAFGDVATITVVPIPLHIQSSGANVVLTWSDASFSLQSSTNVTGPYTTITGAVSGFTTNTALAEMFFRLYRP